MTVDQTINLLDTALAYAARGWHVIALHAPAPTSTGCSCGKPVCDSPAKHPHYDQQLLPDGLKSATTDPAIIRAWWARWPDANIGIVTGAISGLWVLDVDPRHGGDLSLESYQVQYGPLPETLAAQTGGGGLHYLFQHPGSGTRVKNRAAFAPGLDVRGDGGYIVAAGSVHVSGQRYEWLISPDDQPLIDAPDWLLNLVIVQPGQHQQAVTLPPMAANGHAELPARTINYLFFGAQNGERNEQLYRAAQQFHAAGYTIDEAKTQLIPRAQADGLTDQEIDRTISSAYQSTQVAGPALNPKKPRSAKNQAQQPSPAQNAPVASPAGSGQTTAANTTNGSTSNQQSNQPGQPTQQQAQPQPTGRVRQSTRIISQLTIVGYTFKLNLCNNDIEINGEPLDDVTMAKIMNDARDFGISPLNAVQDAYIVEAANHAYHPIKDYLGSVAWNGDPHIARLANCLHGTDPDVVYPDGTSKPLVHVYIRRWLIGAVAKVYEAAQNVMLVLCGPQNCGKSALAAWLCAVPGYFREGTIDLANKDTLIGLMSCWIWEVSELDATTRKADVSALKAFITRSTVTVRKAYGRHDTTKPALTSFIGTVNPSTGFLTDETGNRRFLVASISGIDWSYTQIDRDQVWAEAVAAYRAGEGWRLEPCELAVQEEVNKQHEAETPLEGWIQLYFEISPSTAQSRMTSAEILNELRSHGIRLTGSERSTAMELSRVLKRLGVKKIRGHGWYGYEGLSPKVGP